jgi:hypothetical protein
MVLIETKLSGTMMVTTIDTYRYEYKAGNGTHFFIRSNGTTATLATKDPLKITFPPSHSYS